MRRFSIPLIVALVVLGGFLYLYASNARNTAPAQQNPFQEGVGGSGPTPEITQRVTPTVAISPTPQGQVQVAGEVTEIIGPVAYKNSTAIEINDEMRVYITSATKIVDQQNKSVDRALLRRDATIVVSGRTIASGLEATTITVVSLATTPAVGPSGMNQTSPSRIPTP